MLDSFKREINYLRISVTDRCNLRCIYCMPLSGITLKRSEEILSYEEIIQIAAQAARMGIKKIRLTGGEPLLRRNIGFLIQSLKELAGIHEVCLTTNGVLLDKLAAEIKRTGLDRINISLDTLDAGRYQRITRIGDIRDVHRGIAAASACGFENTKINMVLLPGINDDETERMKDFCRERGLGLQRINHYSLRRRWSPRQPRVASERPPPCRRCNRIRLTADGKLKPCLFSNEEFAVDFADIAASIRGVVARKPLTGTSCSVRQNWQIGG